MILYISICLHVAYFNVFPDICQEEVNYFSVDNMN